MRKKRIKTFSVDERVYDELITFFRDSNVEVSLSYFVDKSLKELLKYLRVLHQMKQDERYTVPMSYIIDNVVRSKYISSLEVSGPEGTPEDIRDEIEEWQNRYEAERKSIPYKFYGLVKSGKFALSKDKKHVVNIKTGTKYTVSEEGFIHDYLEEEDKHQT